MKTENFDIRPCRFGLGVMSGQLYMKSAGDDWTGVASSAKRRKLQNRLNQRAYRDRKRLEYRQAAGGGPSKDGHHPFPTPESSTSPQTLQSPSPPAIGPHQGRDEDVAIIGQGHTMIPTPALRERVLEFARQAYVSYSLGAHRPSQLHLLVKLNALNAIARNATLLGLNPDCLCADEIMSPFNSYGPSRTGTPTYPKSLQPTATQVSLRHHPWMDLFPFPVMRDRAIRAFESGLLDEDEFCFDLLKMGDTQFKPPCLIVWGDSSDPYGWEASAPFLEKYGWLVWGCAELLEATNYWRRKRGDKCI